MKMERSDLGYCLRLLLNSIEILTQNQRPEYVLANIELAMNALHEFPIRQLRQVMQLLEQARTYLEISDGVSEHSFERGNGVGRPRKVIPSSSLEHLLSLNFTVPMIAKLFQLSSRTITRRLAEAHLSVGQTYSVISDSNLEARMSQIILNHPNTGFRRMKGYLLDSGIKITKRRLILTMKRLDPIGVAQRRQQNRTIYRRQYYVQYSMEIWHIDTHHKLIRWGLVVRGGIDGKSRTIVYLDIGNDNTARSNLSSFMTGVAQYGVPLRTRSDKGGENVEVARFMLENRGFGRGSHICGRSVHNQRIERLWRDVHYGCLSPYRCTLIQLEEDGHLNIDVPLHVAVLQRVFVPRIRKSLQEFMAAWNLHSMRTENGRTPLQLMLSNLPPAEYDLSYPAPENEGEFAPINDPNEFNLFEAESIQLEDFQSSLSYSQLAALASLDPMKPSSSFGADIYIEAIRLTNS